MLEIFIFLQKLDNLEHENQYAVITHANTSNYTKIPTFLEKVGDDVILVQCPFNFDKTNMYLHKKWQCTLFRTNPHF